LQNYPNPFNPSTNISWRLAASSHVTLKIYDMLGKEIVTLVNKELNAGLHSVNWNAPGLTSGVYIYRLSINTGSSNPIEFTRKMLLLK